MKKSFEGKGAEVKVEQEKLKFKYSPENPPPLEVLESKMFVVHATPILPKNGILKAGARNITEKGERQIENEPPSFRPTIHFSLGELVQEHDGHSWNDSPYAVVAPLKAIEGQLINVLPHDTFTLGDLPLQKGMVVFVPLGTEISDLPPGVIVRKYSKTTGLRKAVDTFIEEKDGWRVQMKAGGVSNGDVAHIEDVEINNPKFFKSLFEKFPHVSYGTHIYSERGDAFRFGAVEQGLVQVMKTYSPYWFKYNAAEIVFHRSFIAHNLQKLERALDSAAIDARAKDALEEKKVKLTGWLNIIDCDLETRERLGKSLAGAPASIFDAAGARRSDPAGLRQFVDGVAADLPEAPTKKNLKESSLAEMLACLPPQEMEQLRQKNKEMFKQVSSPVFYAEYAIKRWVVVNSDEAVKEGLDRMIEDSLSSEPSSTKRVFENLRSVLSDESNRLAAALVILKNPVVRRCLANRCDIRFEGEGPNDLRDVIAAAPETKILFEKQEAGPVIEQSEGYRLLEEVDRICKPRIDQEGALGDFEKACSRAMELRHITRQFEEDLGTVSEPMNTTRDLRELPPGESLMLYEVLKQWHEDAASIWQDAELRKGFRTMFPDDELFWKSGKSLLQIYRELKAGGDERNELRETATVHSPERMFYDPKDSRCLLFLDKKLFDLDGIRGVAERNGFDEKSRLHVTVLGYKGGKEVAKAIKSFPPEEQPVKAAEVRALIDSTDWSFASEPGMYHVSKEYKMPDPNNKGSEIPEIRESYIQRVVMPGMKDFYSKLNALLGTHFEPPPPHVTLFTGGTNREQAKKGIGINSEAELMQLKPELINETVV